MNIIKDTFRLYALTLVIPLTSTFVAIVLLIFDNRFFEAMYDIWIGYYFTGTVILGIVAWRIQLAILFVCFFISLYFNYSYDSRI